MFLHYPAFSYKDYAAILLLRGGVKIEKRENLGQCPDREGGGVKKTETSQF